MNDCLEEQNDTTLSTALLFALSSAIAGVGGGIYFTLGSTYIDNNVKKSQAPILFCMTSFVRLLAPALGFNMASFFLKYYVVPDLHPKINDDDPRWVGAWWIGYIVFAVSMFILAPILCLFPKVLPRAALRRKQELLKKMKNVDKHLKDEKESETSVKGCQCLSFF
jgi:MFS family permease